MHDILGYAVAKDVEAVECHILLIFVESICFFIYISKFLFTLTGANLWCSRKSCHVLDVLHGCEIGN